MGMIYIVASMLPRLLTVEEIMVDFQKQLEMPVGKRLSGTPTGKRALTVRHSAYPAAVHNDTRCIVDTAANHGVCGAKWMEAVDKRLRKVGLTSHKLEVNEEYFGLDGDNPLQTSTEVTFPGG